MSRRHTFTGVTGRLSGLAALIAMLACCPGCSKTPENKPGEVPKAGALKNVSLRVAADDLSGLLDGKDIRILDVRDAKDYDEGHVPGAVRVEIGEWKAAALRDDGKGLSDKAAWETLVRAAGINEFTQIVVYSNDPTSAARIWWTLKYLGAEKVGILDGGWKAWTAAGGKTATEASTIKPGDFNVDFDPDRLAVIDELKRDKKSADIQIVDARNDGEFGRGKIGDAVHLEWKELMAADGKLKSDEELKTIFAGRKLDASKTAVTYCQTGGRAALNAYALELAGFKSVKNYYCSWSQWSKPASGDKKKGDPKPKGGKSKP